VIALIHGYCIGGGLMVAMDADLRIAADDAQFGVPAGRLGVGYPYDAVQALVALVGPGRAAEILFTAERLDAASAFAAGLVDRVVPKGDLDAVVSGLAATIAANAPLSVRAAKTTIRAITGGSKPADVARSDEAVRTCWRSEDFAEGRRAFAEHRPPVFQGR
jgi:enoyl-CoA hydratase/carnithine racemase